MQKLAFALSIVAFVYNSEGHLLLVQRSKDRRDKWSTRGMEPIAGKVEACDKSLADAVFREVSQETHINRRHIFLAAHEGSPFGAFNCAFLNRACKKLILGCTAVIQGNMRPRINPEISNFAFIKPGHRFRVDTWTDIAYGPHALTRLKAHKHSVTTRQPEITTFEYRKETGRLPAIPYSHVSRQPLTQDWIGKVGLTEFLGNLTPKVELEIH